jgi:histidinol-phosphate/aromatic aminotransferase/cobyric acid decarboxylase-like protein
MWIDEAYVDYVGASESLERFAAESENIIVCKTMSKVYALSGMRVAYLCASPHQLSDLITLTPPWAVGLPAQVAAVRALEDAAYYEEQYRSTHLLRGEMHEALRGIGIHEIVPGEANFLMFHLDESQPTAVQVIERARGAGVFVRVSQAWAAILDCVRFALQSKIQPAMSGSCERCNSVCDR